MNRPRRTKTGRYGYAWANTSDAPIPTSRNARACFIMSLLSFCPKSTPRRRVRAWSGERPGRVAGGLCRWRGMRVLVGHPGWTGGHSCAMITDMDDNAVHLGYHEGTVVLTGATPQLL